MNWIWNWIKSLFAKKQPKPTPIPTPEPQPQPSTYSRVGWDDAKFHTAPESIRTWPVVDRMTIKMAGSRFTYTLEHPELWPVVKGDKPTVGNLWTFLNRGGCWHGGPCDKLRPPGKGSDKERKDCCVPDGDTRLYVPVSGETVGIALSGFCRMGGGMSPQQLTEVCWVKWP
jgi:hypothetical protein